MLLMMKIFIMLFMISMMIYILNMFIFIKQKNIREKIFPLECGFNMINSYCMPFSIQFYYISILFLIFDVEISFLLPMIQKLNFFNMNLWLLSLIIIMMILLIGLYIEWIMNMIKWIK